MSQACRIRSSNHLERQFILELSSYFNLECMIDSGKTISRYARRTNEQQENSQHTFKVYYHKSCRHRAFEGKHTIHRPIVCTASSQRASRHQKLTKVRPRENDFFRRPRTCMSGSVYLRSILLQGGETSAVALAKV
eukprot:768733-Hanusia_phi.AAC.10